MEREREREESIVDITFLDVEELRSHLESAGVLLLDGAGWPGDGSRLSAAAVMVGSLPDGDDDGGRHHREDDEHEEPAETAAFGALLGPHCPHAMRGWRDLVPGEEMQAEGKEGGEREREIWRASGTY